MGRSGSQMQLCMDHTTGGTTHLNDDYVPLTGSVSCSTTNSAAATMPRLLTILGLPVSSCKVLFSDANVMSVLGTSSSFLHDANHLKKLYTNDKPYLDTDCPGYSAQHHGQRV